MNEYQALTRIIENSPRRRPLKQKDKMYEVWCTQGHGAALVAKFVALPEAIKYCKGKIKREEGSFEIKLLNGKWHNWPD